MNTFRKITTLRLNSQNQHLPGVPADEDPPATLGGTILGRPNFK